MPNLPSKIIAGYAFACDETVLQGVRNGVNVVIWFSIDLVTKNGNPAVESRVDQSCISQVQDEIRAEGFDVVHLVCIGGWNAKHPSTAHSAEEMFEAFVQWNNGLFAGIDWDIEGNDDVNSVYNHFTIECLDLMGTFSQLAKNSGLFVSMAPAESYLDPKTDAFDLSLQHEYEEWKPLIPPFRYHGHNTYAYLLSKYGMSKGTPTFDFVTVQFYESYSHLLYDTRIKRIAPFESIVSTLNLYFDGWKVDFKSANINHESAIVTVPPTKLVIGLANGWADNKKSLLLRGFEIKPALDILRSSGTEIRGFAVWNMRDEGITLSDGNQLFLFKELAELI